MPTRIHKSPAPGWQLPENTVDVESSQWANPYNAANYQFAIGGLGSNETRPSTAAEQVKAYWRDLTCTDDMCLMFEDEHPWMRNLDVSELAGKDLACSCPPEQSCHADVLLALANDQDSGR